MRDLLFHQELTQHRFARAIHNLYNHNSRQASTIIVTRDSKRAVPIITLGSTFHYESGVIMYSRGVQFQDMRITKEKAIEVLETSAIPIIINYNKAQYLMGKGFLSEFSPSRFMFSPSTIKPLMIVAMRPNGTRMSDTVAYVASEVHTIKENRSIQVLVNTFLEDYRQDIIQTVDILKYIGERIEIPQFPSFQQRKEYVDNLLRFCIKETKVSPN